MLKVFYFQLEKMNVLLQELFDFPVRVHNSRDARKGKTSVARQIHPRSIRRRSTETHSGYHRSSEVQSGHYRQTEARAVYHRGNDTRAIPRRHAETRFIGGRDTKRVFVSNKFRQPFSNSVSPYDTEKIIKKVIESV